MSGPTTGTLTATRRRAVDALSQLKRCIDDADAANACFLAADLLAGGHSQRLLCALVDALADARYFAPAIPLGVAADVADLATTMASFATPLHATEPAVRHRVFLVTVRLCLIAKRGAGGGGGVLCPRALQAHKLSYAPLAQLRAASLPALQRAPQPDLAGKVAHALAMLRTQDGELERLRIVSLIARSAPQVPLVAAEGPYARTMRVLQTVVAARPRACFTVAAFAGPGPFSPAGWTPAEHKNALYAVLKTNAVFDGLADAAVREAEREGEREPSALVGDVAADPHISRGVDALFRRRAKFDRLYGFVPRSA